MDKILTLVAVRPPQRERKLTARASNLVSYAASGLLLSAALTGVLAISVLLSLTHLM